MISSIMRTVSFLQINSRAFFLATRYQKIYPTLTLEAGVHVRPCFLSFSGSSWAPRQSGNSGMLTSYLLSRCFLKFFSVCRWDFSNWFETISTWANKCVWSMGSLWPQLCTTASAMSPWTASFSAQPRESGPVCHGMFKRGFMSRDGIVQVLNCGSNGLDWKVLGTFNARIKLARQGEHVFLLGPSCKNLLTTAFGKHRTFSFFVLHCVIY